MAAGSLTMPHSRLMGRSRSCRTPQRQHQQRRRTKFAAPRCSAVPQAVVFDLGKVLLDFDYNRSARSLSEACQAPVPAKQEVLLELFGHSSAPKGLLGRWGGRSLVEQLERGQLSDSQFYEAVCEASGLQLGFPEFAALYANIFTPMPAMIQQQALLHAAGVPTYLLSNCSGLHIGDVARRHPFMATFRGLCLSYAERCFKPEPAIYAAAERITGLQGPDLVFIDDRAENAAAASARGWRAIHHTSAESTLRELHELGLPVVQAR